MLALSTILDELLAFSHYLEVLYNLFKLKNVKLKAKIIENDKKPKLNIKLLQLEIIPNKTGPIRKPTNPIPETIEMPVEAGTPSVCPANLNTSGIITDNPKPKTPNPNTVKIRLEDRIKK